MDAYPSADGKVIADTLANLGGDELIEYVKPHPNDGGRSLEREAGHRTDKPAGIS